MAFVEHVVVVKQDGSIVTASARVDLASAERIAKEFRNVIANEPVELEVQVVSVAFCITGQELAQQALEALGQKALV